MSLNKGGRYDASGLVEAQFEPGSRNQVLKNLLGIKSKKDMDRVEAIALKQTEDALFRASTYGKDHKFSAKDICRIHEIWLGNIYEWAGRYRRVELSKGDFGFASARYIPDLMQEFEQGPLHQHTPCVFHSRDRVIKALAEVHTELVLIHPFREGNGRAARILATLMALQANFPTLDFRPIQGERRDEYIAAIHAGLDKNYGPMEEVFSRILQR